METKVFYQPHENYHKDGSRVSKSGLDRLNRSPAHFLQKTEPTQAMDFGSAYHCASLEPDLYDPKNYGKLYSTDPPKITEMCKILHDNERFHLLYRNSHIEYTVYADLLGVPCKVKPDLMNRPNGIVADLKSVVSALPEDFSKACFNFRYHVQAAMNLEAVRLAAGNVYQRFVFICQEKKPPYAIAWYEATEEMLRLGRIELARNLETYKECRATDSWPLYHEQSQYTDEILYIDLPYWAR